MTPEEAYSYFLPYIQDRCVACDAWPLTLCDSETVWVHSRRLAALNKKIPSEVMYKARSKPRPIEREPEDDMDIYFYGYEILGGPKVVKKFTGDRNLIGKFAEEFFSTIYFYAKQEDAHGLDQAERERASLHQTILSFERSGSQERRYLAVR